MNFSFPDFPFWSATLPSPQPPAIPMQQPTLHGRLVQTANPKPALSARSGTHEEFCPVVTALTSNASITQQPQPQPQPQPRHTSNAVRKKQDTRSQEKKEEDAKRKHRATVQKRYQATDEILRSLAPLLPFGDHVPAGSPRGGLPKKRSAKKLANQIPSNEPVSQQADGSEQANDSPLLLSTREKLKKLSRFTIKRQKGQNPHELIPNVKLMKCAALYLRLVKHFSPPPSQHASLANRESRDAFLSSPAHRREAARQADQEFRNCLGGGGTPKVPESPSHAAENAEDIQEIRKIFEQRGLNLPGCSLTRAELIALCSRLDADARPTMVSMQQEMYPDREQRLRQQLLEAIKLATWEARQTPAAQRTERSKDGGQAFEASLPQTREERSDEHPRTTVGRAILNLETENSTRIFQMAIKPFTRKANPTTPAQNPDLAFENHLWQAMEKPTDEETRVAIEQLIREACQATPAQDTDNNDDWETRLEQGLWQAMQEASTEETRQALAQTLALTPAGHTPRSWLPQHAAVTEMHDEEAMDYVSAMLCTPAAPDAHAMAIDHTPAMLDPAIFDLAMFDSAMFDSSMFDAPGAPELPDARKACGNEYAAEDQLEMEMDEVQRILMQF